MKLLIVAALMFPALVVIIATWLDYIDTYPKSPKTALQVATGIVLALYGILYLVFGY